MAYQFTEEELRLVIGDAVINNAELTIDDLIEDLFAHDQSNVPSVIESFITTEFIRQSKNLCRVQTKNWIATNLKNGSSDFIRRFVAAEKQNEIIKIFPLDLQTRLLILQEKDVLGSLLIECNRLFNRLREKFAPSQAEDRFRNFLAQWFQSGFMPLSIWKVFDQWKRNGSTLSSLKTIKWPAGIEKDGNLREIQRLLKNIKTDNFVEVSKLQTILDILLAVPKIDVKDGIVKLLGRIVYLSQWVQQIQDSIKLNNATQVAIFAEDALAIDCDLTEKIWQGKNLTIVTKVVYIWQDSKIQLSGESYSPANTKALGATSTAYRGADGAHGRPGESSGNIAILATKMFNPLRLTVELNGGRGEDGQDGGDGCDGRNGVGVTKSDLDRLVVSYYSLYRDSWGNFQDYSPPSNWTKQKRSGDSSSGEYIYRTYQDEHGRMMTYSFAADKGWTYSTYELYFLICGSNGTSGTSGGSNGVGGQGGYNGTCTVQNPETGEDFQINIIRHGKSSGPNGNNGKVGQSGKHGINGNDMALIDRSSQEASKHYEGNADRKLAWSYVYKAEYKSRLNGYQRYVEKENACFIKFQDGETIDNTERRASKAQEQTTRKAASEAIAKQSIVISKVLNEAEAVFGKQSAFLADACEATTKAAVDGDDGEEEEETAENVTEEVVILRQKENTNKLSKYTPESEKKQRPVYTQDTYVTYVKSVGRRTTVNNCAQILFDLFNIEFTPTLLESISLHTLFHQIRYRQQMQSSFALVLVAALQSKLVNGKSYEEIKEFTSNLFIHRKRKFNHTRLRHKLQNISKEVDDALVHPSMNLLPGADKYFGIKESPLSIKLVPYTDPINIKSVIKAFFSQYLTNEVNAQLLNAFNTFKKNIKPMYTQRLELFAQNENFRWTDKDVVQTYLNSLKAWLVEDALLKKEDKKKKKKKDKEENIDSQDEDDEPDNYSKREKTKSEVDFENFLKVVVADLKYWNQIIKPVNELIAANDEYKARFGSPPSFDKSGYLDSAKSFVTRSSNDDKSIEQAQHLIKIYYVAKSILTYNQNLYIINAMMLKEQEQFPVDICFDNANEFDSFLSQYARYPVPSGSNQCEIYMMKHGLACAPFRYLLSLYLNIKLCTYRKISYQTLQNVEILNPKENQCETLWLQDDKQLVGIAPDEGFRILVAAQDSIVSKYKTVLATDMELDSKIDYNRKENMLAFASYFPSPLQSAVIQWIENYIVITQDQSLLYLLHNRLWIDGCHFSLFELQFILVSVASLKTLYHCDINYLLLLANSVSQSQLVDVFLYARLEYHFGRRFSSSSKIFSGIQLIPNTRYKALLAVKLSDHHSSIDEDDIYKIILMLQHASNGSEQLVKIGLDEWIAIAQKQKWSEIGYLLQQYGSIGYYLGVLDNKGFKEEEQKMREIINKATIIPEKIIALFTQWIVTKEISADDDFFKHLEENFIRTNDYPELRDKITKHQLITTEIEQAKLINWMSTGKISENHVTYEGLTSMDDRKVDELTEKITGLHDSLENVEKRRESIRTIGKLLKTNDSENSSSIYWLNEFDKVLFKLKGKHLRDTQKMAVLCAVESDKHVLEQVNTGEGKSFIIAAMATIHCKTGKRYVDIITSSPVLAQRDAAEMAEIYIELGLNVADNCNEDLEARKKAYTADIVYGDIARFQRDHLLHTFYKKPLKGDRTQVAVIVDEVDNMLLDNGNNMLYLSHSIPGMDLLDSLIIFIQQKIYSPIYTGDKKNLEQMQEQFDNATIKKKVLADIFGLFSIEDLKAVIKSSMSDTKILSLYEKLIQDKIIDSDGYLKIHRHNQLKMIDETLKYIDGAFIYRIKACFAVILSRERFIEMPVYLRTFAKLHLDELIENCKHALFLEANTGYVVDVDRTGKMTTALEPLITIIDSNTGADLATSQWCGGLHQFLQLKHGCRLSPMSLKAVFVSNVAYLKGYQHINGLSGTLGSTEESKTLIELYNADLIKIPTNKPKVFYEHVPAIATVQEKWIGNIYDEICDQVSGTRSVLLICEDIKQLEYVYDGLNKCFNKDKNVSEKVKECFRNITVYKREHDEFNFEDDHKLESHRLIIATNLAGRGTDIKLSKSLIDAGGLHVITAFMPKNCRIEEQAFGRAARCGQPGSAQIIAFAEPENETIQPSVFQLKMFRDNAEVHRLQSLKSFYDYHTEIEEACLEKFRSYCDQALSAIYSKSSTVNDESLPTPSQVVYFALLDQWALWLDSKASLIKQCASEHSQHLKDTIINSVDEFLNKHQFGNQSNCFEVAKSWIDAPQSLLTIGIIQMFHKNGFKEAEDTFNKILADGYEFGGEAFYYKACMRMRNFDGTRQESKLLTLNQESSFKENIEEAIEYFYKARTLFLHRLQRKQKEASLVAQMIEKLPENNPKTSGFASQLKSITTYIQLILTNIDYLLGSPCHPNMFVEDEISESYSKEIHDAFYRQGLISPILLTGRPIENWQIEPIRQKYKLNRKQIETLIGQISKDPTSVTFENHTVFDRAMLLEKCPLSTKSKFWTELEQQKALYNADIYLIVQDQSSLSKEFLEKLTPLKPYSVTNLDEMKTLLRYSDETTMDRMYKLSDVENSIGDNQNLKDEIYQLVDKRILKLDKLANILIIPDRMSYFSDFDGVTTDDFKEFFHLDNHAAGWIMNMLQENGILQLQTIQMTRLTSDNKIWSQLVRIHLEKDAKKPIENDPIELKLLYDNAGILQQIKDNHKLLNVTEQVIDLYFRIPSKLKREETVKKFYTYLAEKNILESYVYNIWRLNSKLDCSSLPSCIANHIDEFLADRFAYTFALEEICLSLEKANKDPSPSPSRIFLPENPFREVYEDFVNCGLAMPSRICVSSGTIDDFDYEDFQGEETIKSVVYSNRLKLYDQTDYHMDLIPFSTYVLDQDFSIDSDLRNIINNGLKVVITRKKETAGSWLLNKLIAGAAYCWNGIKSAASAVASFGYSVVEFIVHLPGKIFSTISDFAAPYVKQAGELIQRIAKPLLDTKVGKAAVATMQFAKECVVEVGYKAVESAEWVIRKGTELTNYVGTKASELTSWVADTRPVQGMIGLAKDFGSWVVSTAIWKSAAEMATYIYTKMSNFCTAISESYQYYNQCRTISRRIVIEKRDFVDEHTILKTFHDISRQEAKKSNDNLNTDEIIRKHIESWRMPLVKSLMSTCQKKLQQLSKDKYTVEFVKSSLKKSFALNNLESEISNLLNFYAWNKQTFYFKTIRTAFKNNTPLNKTNFLSAEGIPIELQFFIDDGIDQILEDFQKRIDDEGYESDSHDNEILIDSANYENWKDAFEAVVIKLIQNAVDSVFIEKTISVILSYIAGLRDANMPPSEAEISFNQEDKSLKLALVEYKSSNQSKRKAQFLMTELHSIISKNVDICINKDIIKTAIKYGYPLPLSSATLIVTVMDRFLTESKIYSAGINLIITDHENHDLVKFKTKDGKAKLQMRHFNGSVFLCQSDYRACIGMSDQMYEEVDEAFFYEAFIGYMKNLHSKFPRQAETLREGILKEFEHFI
ncbi:unnamed protein product [Rotaria magnacalcarata]|uniref:Protein translocase subunit SecA n=2 Tax=Rotaria magnacalcarata TaxID=392030 RepID=A0A816KTV3_9BILA|nr:unnamed protein product [Rotaria magnacalcarata]CAF1924872.1 unnamed protein product [Rotaria magnacalcarata]